LVLEPFFFFSERTNATTATQTSRCDLQETNYFQSCFRCCSDVARSVVFLMASALKHLFFSKRPEICADNEMGEVSVYVPAITDRFNPLFYQFQKKKRLFFFCPLRATCLDLKLRIKGVIKIPVERIVLFYLGAVIDDQQVSR
jgi:hypothetical protein